MPITINEHASGFSFRERFFATNLLSTSRHESLDSIRNADPDLASLISEAIA